MSQTTTKTPKRLFACCLTNFAPSANYGGDSGGGPYRPIQRITRRKLEYPIVSAEAIRSAWREVLATLGLACSRKRILSDENPRVQFDPGTPNENLFADEFFFGYMFTKSTGRIGKRQSPIQNNKAMGVLPYRGDTSFHQYPKQSFGTEDAPKKGKKEKAEGEEEGEGDTKGGGLFQSEVSHNAFQYPFAMDLEECGKKPLWTRTLLEALAQLTHVSGNQTRSWFEFNPASIILRATDSLTCEFDQYPFVADEATERVSAPSVFQAILDGDLPGREFYVGGNLVRHMEGKLREELQAKEVHLHTSVKQVIEILCEAILPKE